MFLKETRESLEYYIVLHFLTCDLLISNNYLTLKCWTCHGTTVNGIGAELYPAIKSPRRT